MALNSATGRQNSRPYPGGLLFKHIVFFRFHDAKNAPEDKRRLEAMEGQVADLSAIEVGLELERFEGEDFRSSG